MEKRHSSPFSRAESPRPRTCRKRSNSFPLSDALGCSTPEAELILAEGRAAVHSRLADRQRGRRRREDIRPFRPKDHIGYLVQGSAVSEAIDTDTLLPAGPKAARHTRIPSNDTDRSAATVVAPNQPTVEDTSSSPISSSSPLGDYSAQLAQFIRSQLNSIPTYRPGTSLSPRSCPDMSFARSPPLSPARPVSMRRHVGAPSLIEIPSVRPPARSAFSAWSSTDDDTDDEAPPLPDIDLTQTVPKTDTYTSSVLRYYEQTNESTFLFTSTPLGNDEEPDTAKAFSFPVDSSIPGTSAEPRSTQEDDYPSSDLSRPSLLSSSSSAPSPSTISNGSYFEYTTPPSKVPDLKDRIIAVVTPPVGKVIPAISPFEGGALANVHDILVQSRQRVLVDGMSFDMVGDFSVSDQGVRHVQTPC